MNRILLVWKGRNQIFHLHFSQYCLEHLHLQKHSTFLQLVEPNGVEANLEVAFALLSALGTCFKTDIWVWSWTVMLLPWQSKRNKIRHTLCCEVGCAATEHIYCVSELSPGTRTAKHHLTLNSLHNITTGIPFIIPVSFTLQGKGEQKEEYFSSPSKYPILSFQQQNKPESSSLCAVQHFQVIIISSQNATHLLAHQVSPWKLNNCVFLK